jgi:L-iditol 2-dehydrogenase
MERRMKALVLTAPKQFAYRDVPVPVPGDREVLVRVKACGICGSDVHGMDGSTGRRRPPIIMGHEASGVIAAVGPAVDAWAPGDRVTFDSTVYCGACAWCRAGRVNLCDHRRVLGVSCDEYRCDGAMAEYVAVPQRILCRLPDAVRFPQGAMVEPLSIAVHAVARARIAADDTAVVVGAGVIGLLTVQALRAAGCGRILAVDIDADRLVLARRLGADRILDAVTEAVAAAVREDTGGRGADVVFEAVGIASTVQTAAAALRKGGQLVLIGNLAPTVEFPLQTAVTRELSVYGSCASAGEYPDCLEMIANGAINVDALLSAAAPLAEGADWFRRLSEREPGLIKVILQPPEGDAA